MNDVLNTNQFLFTCNSIKAGIINQLPDYNVNLSKACLGTDTMFIRVYLAKDKTEMINGIIDNDMINLLIMITDYGDGMYTVEYPQHKFIIKPINKYLWCSYQSIKCRKITGDYSKVSSNVFKTIDGMKHAINTALQDNLIHDSYVTLLQKRLLAD